MLNDLVRDLKLTKNNAEILDSFVKQKNLLEKDTKISKFRLRHKKYHLSSMLKTVCAIAEMFLV